MHAWPFLEIKRLLMLHKPELAPCLEDLIGLDLLIEKGVLDRKDLLFWAQADLGLELIERVPEPIESLLEIVKELSYEAGVLPLKIENGVLYLAALNPFEKSKQDELGFILGRRLRWVLMDPIQVELGLASLHTISIDLESPEFQKDAFYAQGTIAAKKSPLSAWLEALLEHALSLKASDIHLELTKDQFLTRLRIGTKLHCLPVPALSVAPYVMARLKHLAHMDVTETRLPQDGRFSYPYKEGQADFRLSALPVEGGESLVLRVLDPSRERPHLEQLGFASKDLLRVKQALLYPQGCLLVTGPTGSGKTTTLYAMVEILMGPSKKTMTVEDPIEYQLESATQVSVRNTIGLSFEVILKASLRHDPDILMIGEIRDAQTAAIAIQATLTGHKVLSTLHAIDPLSAIFRLSEWGIAPYLLAEALEGIISQRLFYPGNMNFFDKNQGTPQKQGTANRFFPKQRAILEFLELNFTLKEAIARGEPIHVLRQLAYQKQQEPLEALIVQAAKRGEIDLNGWDLFESFEPIAE